MKMKTILIVEDELIIRRLCERLLSAPDRRLILVDSVDRAYQAIEQEDIDALLTDLRLPDGNGVDVIKRFKEKYPHKGVVIMTGSPSPENHIAPIAHFQIECLTKPFDPPTLQESVRKALE